MWRVEHGDLAGITIGSLERVTEALGATLSIQVRWQGERLDRLMDAAHAALQARVAELLSMAGWIVRAEVSFNHYGDRGRVDLVALHPRLRAVLIVEVKSALGDLQDTLGRLDVKVRLARTIAAELGWGEIDVAVPVLVIAQSRGARRIVGAHEPLFRRYALRGRQAVAWLRRPSRPAPDGILWLARPPDSRQAVTNRR